MRLRLNRRGRREDAARVKGGGWDRGAWPLAVGRSLGRGREWRSGVGGHLGSYLDRVVGSQRRERRRKEWEIHGVSGFEVGHGQSSGRRHPETRSNAVQGDHRLRANQSRATRLINGRTKSCCNRSCKVCNERLICSKSGWEGQLGERVEQQPTLYALYPAGC